MTSTTRVAAGASVVLTTGILPDAPSAAAAERVTGFPQRRTTFGPPSQRRSLSDAARDLDRCHLVRARQRAGAHVQRDRRARSALQLRPREGRQPDRLREVLQGRGEAGPRRRDRQGVRGREGRVRLHGRRGLRGGAGRGLQDDRDPGLRSLRRDRPDLLRADVLPGAAGGRREGLCPAPARDGGLGARGDRHVCHARAREPGLPAHPRRRDRPRAHVLRGRDQTDRRHRPRQGQGRRARARDGGAADRPLLGQVRARAVRGHLSRAPARDRRGQAEGQGGTRRAAAGAREPGGSDVSAARQPRGGAGTAGVERRGSQAEARYADAGQGPQAQAQGFALPVIGRACRATRWCRPVIADARRAKPIALSAGAAESSPRALTTADEVDRLYAAPLDQFTDERNALVRKLRDEGRRDDAEAVRALRKPSVPLWVLNQLARERPDDVRALVAAAERLSKGAMDEDAGRRPTDGMVDRVAAMLRAAAANPDARADLAGGRLTSEPEQSGFEAMLGAAAAPPPAREHGPKRESVDRRKLKEARDAVAAARAEARDLGRKADAAERDARRARKDADRAAAALAAAEERLDAARRR